MSEPKDGRRRRARGGEGTDGAAVPGGGQTRAKTNAVAWTALLVAVVLTIWQAVYALSIGGVAMTSEDTYRSVSLFVSLILSLAAAVLGIVAIAQRRHPRWPGLVGLAVGVNVFVVSVFSWIGGLMNTGA